MTIPLSIHVGASGHAGEPPANIGEPPANASESPANAGEREGTSEVAPSPATATSAEARWAPAAELSAAPTSRPPPFPVRPPPRAAAKPTPSAGAGKAGAERRGWGFTSVIRHLSLRDWLRWIQASRSDAVLRVRTPDGGSGTIWCDGGKVIDAAWAKLTPEAALREMLGLASGAVTIDFEPLERPHRGERATLDLLPVIEASSGPVRDLTGAEAAAAPPSGTVPDPFRHSLSPVDTPPLSHSDRARAQRSRISRGEYLAVGLLLPALVLGAFAIGRLRASSESDYALTVEPQPARQIKSGLLPPPPARMAEPAAPAVTPAPQDLPVISFAAIEVVPANAEVWLDHSLVGVGRIELAPIRDGALHELRFVAEGHAARSLFFIDVPPAGRVILERTAAAAQASDGQETAASDTLADAPGAVSPREDEAAEREPLRRAPRRRAAAPAALAPQRPRPLTDPAAAAASTEVKQSPRVQLIEARMPQVQVLE